MPIEEQSNKDYSQYNFIYQLQLTFGEEPKDLIKGYYFNINLAKYDVLLGDRGAYNINGLHFYITFNDQFKDNFNSKTHLILKDLLRNGMAINYSGQVSEEIQHKFI